jgi:hypothetical protein
MERSKSNKLLDSARTALNDLYGLVPNLDRPKYADPLVRIIEQALYGYSEALGSLRQIESTLYHADKDVDRVAKRIAELETGEV